MKPAGATTRNLLIGVALLAGTSPRRATAGEAPQAESADTVPVPKECMQYWTLVEGSEQPAAWEAVLSFAACIQDARVAHVDHADQLQPLVDQLQSAIEPSLKFYLAIIEEAPDPLRLRAAYAIGMSELSLITRARASIRAKGDRATDPAAQGHFLDLHEQLEPLLEPHAKLAYLLFVTIDQAATRDPALAPDPVTRTIVRSSRQHASEIRKSWPMPRVDAEVPEVATGLHHGESR